MADEANNMDLEEMGLGSKVLYKAQNNPFLTVGVLGFLTTLGIGAYRFKNRSQAYPMSLFFIQLRVTAQSVVIGCITVGMVYNMVNVHILKKRDSTATKAIEN